MDQDQKAAIQRWVDHVTVSQDESLSAHDHHIPTPSSTSLPLHQGQKRKTTSISQMAHPDPLKRIRLSDADRRRSTLGALSDNITLSPSQTGSNSNTSRSRPRSSSPTRVKDDLSFASPRVSFVHESTDPGKEVKDLLSFLMDDSSPWEADTTEIQNITAASCKCAIQLRSEGSWVIEVARPLLQLAIGEQPLECWSVQTESVDPKYQPRYIARDTCNRKIDLVVGFPREEWVDVYKRVGGHIRERCQSHISDPHTGRQLLGLGLEVKASNGDLAEAQVQLGVWMAGLVSWAFDHRREAVLPPPIVGCIAMGDRWEFYIIYGVEDETTRELAEVVGLNLSCAVKC
ncbi:hypothetical protein ASPWEDRAFT_45621 [Aspergillus wentii DTO 134E9]|uniref:PD-(D/E)XK nuclease-like domain-containing protein n=1 Tax=Aspergillus wentii DTO 134E9 TaxID=1073089 RepID=A0A1L9R9Q7_ASPWE|nr:uncharacterized protein ASPWEDRAFT_45621 [Aspergillus wentii DTO 134E9]OJJ31652.1 hypothetical protein ASPWEDRAFT_45621 [Aspergillus wentii DTO 134E9]